MEHLQQCQCLRPSGEVADAAVDVAEADEGDEEDDAAQDGGPEEGAEEIVAEQVGCEEGGGAAGWRRGGRGHCLVWRRGKGERKGEGQRMGREGGVDVGSGRRDFWLGLSEGDPSYRSVALWLRCRLIGERAPLDLGAYAKAWNIAFALGQHASWGQDPYILYVRGFIQPCELCLPQLLASCLGLGI